MRQIDPRQGERNGAVKRRRYVRFTRWRRAHFFRVLEETGHAQMAAAAGVSLACVYRLRRVEAGFAEKMAAVRERADGVLRYAGSTRSPATQDERMVGKEGHSTVLRKRRALTLPSAPAKASADGPLPVPKWERDSAFVVRRGSGGRVRVVALGRCWGGRHDAIFLGHLRVTGNVAGSARAAGFTPKTAWNQRAARPGLARAWDKAMDEAAERLEMRIVAEAHAAMGQTEPDAGAEARPLDVWWALWYLQWRERRQRRGG